ncbi:MAG: hypothetical protein FJZ01_22185 [Candidatus Sericytochromatia bacterium]|nr:hypothetical protein [Candidatus Tanganyikabacteria bacterium]
MAIVGLAALAACTPAAVPGRMAATGAAGRAVDVAAGRVQPLGMVAWIEPGTPVALPAPTLQANKGIVELKVRWPQRIQVIPDAATQVLFELFSGTTLAASASVLRPAGAGTSTGSVEVDAGTYRLLASALAAGAAGLYPVATASAPITVVAGARTSAALTLAATTRAVRVALSSEGGTLDAAAADGQTDAGFTTRLPLSALVTHADGATSSTVNWATSDPTRGSWSGGYAVAAAGAPAGAFTLTGTSTDGARAATATFTVVPRGQAAVVVE